MQNSSTRSAVTGAGAGAASPPADRRDHRSSDGAGPWRAQSGRRVVAAMLLPVLGVALGWAVYALLPPTYTARTEVLVLPTSMGTDLSRVGQDVQMETEAQLARSTQVAAAASDLVDGRLAVDQLLEDSSVTVPSNSQVLVFGFDAGSGVLARDGAAALAEAYLDRRAEEAAARTSSSVAALQAQLDDVTSRLEDLANSPAAAAEPGTTARVDADAQRSLLLDQLSDINSRLVPLRAVASSGGQVISEAVVPAAPSFPSLPAAVGVGLVLGLLAGAAVLATGRPQAGPRDVEQRAARLPVLARVSGGRPGAADAGEQTVALRERLAATPVPDGPLVLVEAADDGSGVDLAVRLAAAWAGPQGDVVVVLTGPGMERGETVRPRPAPGLADVLRREVEAEDVLRPLPSVPGVRVLGPGTMPAEAPGVDDMSRLWRRLGQRHAHVLVVAGAPQAGGTATEVARTAGRILVATTGVDDAADVDLACDELEWWAMGERVLGVVHVQPAPATGDGSGAAAAAPPGSGSRLTGDAEDAGERRRTVAAASPAEPGHGAAVGEATPADSGNRRA